MNSTLNRNKQLAVFSGLSAFIGVFESVIFPLPFFKLGLSNIPVSIGFMKFSFKELLFIVMFKVLFSNIFRGSLFSYTFLISLTGNLFFIFISYCFYILVKKVSFVSVNIIGAWAHNSGQILIATLFIPYKAVLYISPFLLLLGLILGFINGVICNIVFNKFYFRLMGVKHGSHETDKTNIYRGSGSG